MICTVCSGRGTDSTGFYKCRCRKGKCDLCSGQKWMTLMPGNLVAPCVMCSPTRNLSEIEQEKGMRLERDNHGVWYESSLQ